MFQQPREGSKAPVSEMVGSLALFIVKAYKTGIDTSFGPDKDAVECDVHCLDGTHGGEVFEDSLLFQGALIGALKGAIGGEPVLGRIGQGIAKGANNPPYILLPFTDADAAIAGPYWARIQAAQFQAPAPAAAAPPAPQPAAPAAPVPAAAPAPAAPAPAANGQLSAAGFRALPDEVQAMLRASGQVPAGV